jgi:hypothetical protein
MPLPDPAVQAAENNLASLLMQEVVGRSVPAPQMPVESAIVVQPPALTPEPEAAEATESELAGHEVQDSTWGEWEAALDEQDSAFPDISRPAPLRR